MQIIYEPKLSERTTLRLGGKAIAEVRLSEIDDIDALPQTLQKLGGSIFVLGGGSNLLVCDADLPIVFLKTNFKDAPQIIYKDDKQARVTVGAGVRLPRFLGMCAKHGLSGLEGLCGIPGTVGGAIAMNAGSFGDETCPHLESVTIYSPETGIIDIASQDFSYGYRRFSFQNTVGVKSWFLIIKATFILTQWTMDGIKERMFHDFFKKKSTQPIKAWSAGCVFKNPAPDKPAGMLLEQCGFKGKSEGGMAFSSLHANFLINEGKGSSAAAFSLIEAAKQCVEKQMGLRLETEVKILCP